MTGPDMSFAQNYAVRVSEFVRRHSGTGLHARRVDPNADWYRVAMAAVFLLIDIYALGLFWFG